MVYITANVHSFPLESSSIQPRATRAVLFVDLIRLLRQVTGLFAFFLPLFDISSTSPCYYQYYSYPLSAAIGFDEMVYFEGALLWLVAVTAATAASNFDTKIQQQGNLKGGIPDFGT